MNRFYQHTKLIILLLSALNIIVHIAGFFFGIDIFNLFSSLVISELILILLYLVITVYKWINAGFIKIETEQINFSKQLSGSISETLNRVGELESKLLKEMHSSDQKNADNITSQSKMVLEEIHLIKKQTKIDFDQYKSDINSIETRLNKIIKTTEESVEQIAVNNDELDKINIKLNQKSEEVISALTLIYTNSLSIIKIIESNKHIVSSNDEKLQTIIASVNNETSNLLNEFTRISSNTDSVIKKLNNTTDLIQSNRTDLKSIKITVDEEVNKNNEKLTQLITSRNTDLNRIVEEIFTTIALFKTRLAQENTSTSKEIKNLEEVILPKINTVLNNIDTSKVENDGVLDEISQDIKQSKLELESAIQKQFSSHYDRQKNHTDFQLKKELNMVYDRLDALISIHGIINPIAPLPIMHDWRVTADYAHNLLINLLERKGSVIDIGSGISTIILGYAVKQNGSGKVIALEHSKEYFEKSKNLIHSHNLQNICEIYYCPLKEYEINGNKWLWYDVSNIEFPNDISIVSVDGPPGSTQSLARYPAIPILQNHLNKKTLIFIDDGNRKDETEIANLWSKEFDYNLQTVTLGKGWIELSSK